MEQVLGRRGVATLLITLGLTLALVQGDHHDSDLSAPQFVRVINKPRTTSAEIQVQRLINGHIYEPCAGGHVVQVRLSGETDWGYPDHTEKMGGRFVMTGLKPGNSYEIRVACKDNKTPASVGAFSDPTALVTPLTNPKGEGGGGDKDKEDEKDTVSGGRQTTAVAALTTTLVAIIAFTF